MKNDLSDVVLGFDVRFEVQLCDVHEKRVRRHRDERLELQEALVEATICGMCNIVGAEFSGEVDDLELDEVFGECSGPPPHSDVPDPDCPSCGHAT